MKKLICILLVLVFVLSFAPSAFAANDWIESFNLVDATGKVIQPNITTFCPSEGRLQLKITSSTFSKAIYIVKSGANWATTYAYPENGKLTFNLPKDTEEGTYEFYYKYMLPSNGWSPIQFRTVWSQKSIEIVKTPPKPLPKATAIKLNKKSASIYADKTLQLNVNTTPKDASQAVVWTSSNPKIAWVSGTGLVTAVKGGSVTITAATTDGSKLKAACKLKVVSKAKSVRYKKSLTMKKGQVKTVTAKVLPKTAKQDVKYSSSKKSVVSVTSKGKLTARKKGTAKITATTKDGTRIKAVMTVKVK